MVKVVAVSTVVRPAYWEHSGGTGYGRGYPLTEKQELLGVLAKPQLDQVCRHSGKIMVED